MCGVLGLIGKSTVVGDLIHGLLQLQHRGQDAAGIATASRGNDDLAVYKSQGLVTDVFQPGHIEALQGDMGVAHVRYATSGGSSEAELQPIVSKVQDFHMALVFNGNLVNCVPLRHELEAQGVVFSSSSDGEVLLNVLKRAMTNQGSALSCDSLGYAVQEVYRQVEGAYSVLLLIPTLGIVAFRDPQGLRPLVMGSLSGYNGVGFASETYALSFLGYEVLQDVPPGEVWMVDTQLQVHTKPIVSKPRRHCSFEYVYFTKGNAILEGKDVYQVRAQLGKKLAHHIKSAGLGADVVTAVPNTSHPAALRLAWELGICIEEGFIRREHAGRTFILPSQKMRERAVSSKLAPVPSVFRGRRVIIVDDSIVRGTVSKRIIKAARDCGAKEVIFASTFPPITYPCFYGIDMPRPEELIARDRTVEEVRKAIGADALFYNDEQDLREAIGIEALCMACLNGSYPTKLQGVEALQDLRKADRARAEKVLVPAG